jgi:hypothetical protein
MFREGEVSWGKMMQLPCENVQMANHNFMGYRGQYFIARVRIQRNAKH